MNGCIFILYEMKSCQLKERRIYIMDGYYTIGVYTELLCVPNMIKLMLQMHLSDTIKDEKYH